MTETQHALARLAENLASFDAEVAYEMSTECERADLWTEIDVNVEDLRALLAAVNSHTALVTALKGVIAEADRETVPFIKARTLLAALSTESEKDAPTCEHCLGSGLSDGTNSGRCSFCLPEKDAPKDDGWIEWKGGKCPVPDETYVRVKGASGLSYKPAPAGSLSWEYVKAYRVVKP